MKLKQQGNTEFVDFKYVVLSMSISQTGFYVVLEPEVVFSVFIEKSVIMILPGR